MTQLEPLPPGQRETSEFPRFGQWPYARRFPREVNHVSLSVSGEVELPLTISDELSQLPLIEQTSDFHCVTTWTRCGLQWRGYRCSDVYQQIIVPLARPTNAASLILLRGQDGYRTRLPLEDLLARDVLLATELEGQPLSVEHGAPIRVIAPAHYGYKSVEHLSRIELHSTAQHYRPPGPRVFQFMDHPRARVAEEERGVGLPGRLLRYLYRPLIRSTVARFRRAMVDYETLDAS